MKRDFYQGDDWMEFQHCGKGDRLDVTKTDAYTLIPDEPLSPYVVHFNLKRNGEVVMSMSVNLLGDELMMVSHFAYNPEVKIKPFMEAVIEDLELMGGVILTINKESDFSQLIGFNKCPDGRIKFANCYPYRFWKFFRPMLNFIGSAFVSNWRR